MATIFAIGDVVRVKTTVNPGLYVIVNIRNPMGWSIFDVLSIEDGTSKICTILEMEKPDGTLTGEVFGPFDEFQADDTPTLGSRFKKTTTDELFELEMASKSTKTHAMTRWGIQVYRGQCEETLFSTVLCPKY